MLPNHLEKARVSWLSRGPDSSGEVWIGCKRLILKFSKVLLAMEVKGPYMHANRRLTLIQKWCHTRDFQLTARRYIYYDTIILAIFVTACYSN